MTTEPNNGYLVSLVDADAAPVALERTWHETMERARLRFDEVLNETQIEGTAYLHRIELPAGRSFKEFPVAPPANGHRFLVGSAPVGTQTRGAVGAEC